MRIRSIYRAAGIGVIMVAAAAIPASAMAAPTTHNDGTVAATSSTPTVADKPTATIPVGQSPWDMALTPDGNRAYVTDSDSNSVSVIDTATNAVTTTIPVGAWPRSIALAPDGSRAYVANSHGNSVSVIDTAANTVTATISIPTTPVGFGPWGVAVTPDGRYLYVANNDDTVSVIATADNTITTTVSGVFDAGDVAFSPDGSKAYVASYLGDEVSVVDTTTFQVTTIPVVGPTGIAISKDGTRAYVGDETDEYNGVSVIDLATNTVAATIALPYGVSPGEIAVTPDSRTVYATLTDNSVAVIDTATNTISACVPVGTYPGGVAVSPTGGRIYVANENDNTVMRFDAPSAAVAGPSDPVTSGATVTLTGTVTGSYASVQWQHAPTGSTTYADVPGATSATLNLTADATTAGTYRLIVTSGLLGTTTTEPVTLTVTAPAPTTTPTTPGSTTAPTPTANGPLANTGVDPAPALIGLAVIALGIGLIAYRHRAHQH